MRDKEIQYLVKLFKEFEELVEKQVIDSHKRVFTYGNLVDVVYEINKNEYIAKIEELIFNSDEYALLLKKTELYCRNFYPIYDEEDWHENEYTIHRQLKGETYYYYFGDDEWGPKVYVFDRWMKCTGFIQNKLFEKANVNWRDRFKIFLTNFEKTSNHIYCFLSLERRLAVRRDTLL